MLKYRPMETQNRAEALYKDYWQGSTEEREKRAYYERLYRHIKPRLQVQEGWRILDVAGGNGHFMRYMEIKNARLLDISQSGLEEARKSGFETIFGDIERRFPIEENSYDAVFLFEVLEHLYKPNKTLAEIHNILKPGGILYVGQPNMRADGVYHVRRYYLNELLNDVEKTGFKVEWIDYVPAYTMREAILSDIKRNPSFLRKLIQCVNLTLSFLPWRVRYQLAKWIPNRFGLLFVLKLTKPVDKTAEPHG